MNCFPGFHTLNSRSAQSKEGSECSAAGDMSVRDAVPIGWEHGRRFLLERKAAFACGEWGKPRSSFVQREGRVNRRVSNPHRAR